MADLTRGGLPFRHRRQRLSCKPLPDESGQEFRERDDVLSYTGPLESGHVGLPFGEWYDRPRVPARRHHDIHQEASHAPIAIHVRMDVYEHKMPEYHAHR